MSLLTSWLNSPPPDAAIEIAAGRVSAATLTSRGGSAALQAYAVEGLPAGATRCDVAHQGDPWDPTREHP